LRCEDRAVSGWKLWGDPEPIPPGGYKQSRWVRPYRPGLARVLLSLPPALLAVTVAGLGVLGAWAQTGWTGRAIGVAGTVAAAGVLVWLALRVFSAGVWVTDHRVRILGLLDSREMPWTAVVDVAAVDGSRLLGFPVSIPGGTVVLRTSDGATLRTPVCSGSPDFLGRPESFRIAAGALRRWWLECR